MLKRGLMLGTAESCTGGLIAAAITERPGASSVFDRGFVTYSNDAKMEILGVPPAILERHGAVSEECAQAMAQGARQNSRADIAVSVTGIAGPDGGSPEKPVGLVYIGLASRGTDPKAYKHLFTGTRTQIRTQTCEKALEHMITELQQL